MITLPIGLIATLFIFIASVGISNLPLYFNLHSLLLVAVGTVSILLFSNPTSVLKNLGKDLVLLFKPQAKFQDVQGVLTELSKDRFKSTSSADEMIQYAQDLWVQGVDQELFVVLISQKKAEIEQRTVDAIQALKNLAKYPPALGMASTVMGIVTLFQSLDANKDKIGQSLALAMTATFFGLLIANAIVMPLSDRLQLQQIAQKNYLKNVYQVLLLINQEEASSLIEEEVELRAS